MRRAALAGLAVAAALIASPARGAPPPEVRIAALAPADDARRAIAIGEGGEVYDPDGKGGWVHRRRCAIVDPVTGAGRAGGAVLALGNGVIYRLADNGWSALRLVQRGSAILGSGARSLAAVGRQLFALDGPGAPSRLVEAPGDIVAIGASAASIVVATDAGVFRLAGGKLVAIDPTGAAGPRPAGEAVGVPTPRDRASPIQAPPGRPRLAGDRWAIFDHAAVDLVTGKLAAWPAELAVGVTAVGPGGALIAVGAGPDGLELVTLDRGRMVRDRLGVTGSAVGVVVDRAGRAVVALADGRLAVRDRARWTTTTVAEAPASERPGPAPARSEEPGAITGTSAADPR